MQVLDSNIQLPEWLTEQRISELLSDVSECPNPYTEEEFSQFALDEPVDLRRYNAYSAKQILEHYGIFY